MYSCEGMTHFIKMGDPAPHCHVTVHATHTNNHVYTMNLRQDLINIPFVKLICFPICATINHACTLKPYKLCLLLGSKMALRLVTSVAAVILTAATVGNCQESAFGEYQPEKILTAATVGNSQESAKFGECQPEKASCQECYLELVRAVLGRDDNVFNLSHTFTPPTFDQPSFVIVNYRFFNECNNSSNISCVDETHVWFWAKSGAYFLHPLVTFQFLTLFFGNAETLYEREVYVTLNATACYNADPDHMTLLTQRVS